MTSTKEIDISSEAFRTYTYGDGATFSVKSPSTLYLLYDDSGVTHRVVDEDGATHRPTRGWVGITWKPKDGEPSFVA